MTRPADVWAVVPAYRERPEDLYGVVQQALSLDLRVMVVLQDEHVTDALLDACRGSDTLHTTHRPLGKGGAVKEGLLSLAGSPVVVLDADLHALTPGTVAGLAEAAAAGYWARTVHPGAGRLGQLIPGLLALWEVDYPGRLVDGGLLCQQAAYPAHLGDLLDVSCLPDDYGFDLAIALDLHRSRAPLAVLQDGPRVHRPGSRSHLERMAHENLSAIMERSPLWSA